MFQNGITPKAPADTFAIDSPAPVATTSSVKPASAPTESGSEDEHTTQVQSQLRPTGKRSILLDVPLTGTVYHFRKLKDHAVLQLELSKVTNSDDKQRAWIFGGGLAFLGLVWLIGNRREKRSTAIT